MSSTTKNNKRLAFQNIIQGITEITKPFAAMEKRRALRVDVQNSYPPVMIGHFGGASGLFRVKNVAEHGAAFYHEGMDLRSELGRDIQSFLAIGDVKIPIISRILYLTPQLVGMQFVDPTEGTRISIRSHFYLEYTAASLAPRLVTPPPPPAALTRGLGVGATALDKGDRRLRWIKFANDRDHRMEVVSEGEKVKSFRIDLGHEWAIVNWEGGGHVVVQMAGRQEITSDQLRMQIVSFLRNVKGVNPRILQEVGEAVCSQEIVIDYPTPMA